MVNKNLKQICEQAKAPYLSSHKIRFWAVTAMYNQNLPAYVIQYTAGHSYPATTKHYKRFAKTSMDIEQEKWAEKFG